MCLLWSASFLNVSCVSEKYPTILVSPWPPFGEDCAADRADGPTKQLIPRNVVASNRMRLLENINNPPFSGHSKKNYVRSVSMRPEGEGPSDVLASAPDFSTALLMKRIRTAMTVGGHSTRYRPNC